MARRPRPRRRRDRDERSILTAAWFGGCVASQPRAQCRRQPHPPRGRGDRHLLRARMGPTHTGARHARHARRSGPSRQDPLDRLVERDRLAARPDHDRSTTERTRCALCRAAAVQPARPRHRTRGAAVLSRQRHLDHTMVTPRWWLAHRQVQPGRTPNGRRRVSATTPTVASRRTTHATTTAPGTSSTPSTMSRKGNSDQWARLRSHGS